jgi:hypothetical protein
MYEHRHVKNIWQTWIRVSLERMAALTGLKHQMSSQMVIHLIQTLSDEIRYSILPILIGDGVPFFDKLNRDVSLHLAEVKAYKSGIVELRYEVREHRGT